MAKSNRKTTAGKAKPKAKDAPGASRAGKAATNSATIAKGKPAAQAGATSKSPAKAKSTAKRSAMFKSPARAGGKASQSAEAQRASGDDASRRIDERIQSLGDWRGETLASIRRMIHEADPEVVEEWKWMGTPVWSHAGNVCTGETYKQVVKLTFARGASLEDPRGLFNSSLDGNTRRAIDIRQGEVLNSRAFKSLFQAAVAENLRTSASKSNSSPQPGAKSSAGRGKAKTSKPPTGDEAGVVLLAGGNPRIAKADGNAPVQAYIAALTGWKREIAKRVDTLIERNVPSLQKAVKWNSPFYGVEGQGWFLTFHVFTRYLKVTFFRGTSLKPAPTSGTSKEARWIDIHEDDFDERQLTTWVKQAAALPGWRA